VSGFATLTPVGATIDEVTDRLIRNMTAANKTMGKQVAVEGRKAMLADTKARRGSLSFGGRKLNVKAKPRARATGATVIFTGSPAGAWAIISTGTKPHAIRVRSKQALHWGGDAYAEFVQHPGTAGRQYWRSAGLALDKAIEDVIEDTYDKALVA